MTFFLLSRPENSDYQYSKDYQYSNPLYSDKYPNDLRHKHSYPFWN